MSWSKLSIVRSVLNGVLFVSVLVPNFGVAAGRVYPVCALSKRFGQHQVGREVAVEGDVLTAVFEGPVRLVSKNCPGKSVVLLVRADKSGDLGLQSFVNELYHRPPLGSANKHMHGIFVGNLERKGWDFVIRLSRVEGFSVSPVYPSGEK